MSALQEIAIDLEAERTVELDEDSTTSKIRFGALGNWFAGLSIGRKITWFFGVNLGFALLAGLAIIVAFMQVGERAEQINATHDLAIEAEQVVSHLSEAQRHAEVLVIAGDSSRGSLALTELSNADQKLSDLRSAIDADDATAADQIALIAAATEDFRRQINSFNPNASQAGLAAQAGELTGTGSTALDTGRSLAPMLEQSADEMSTAGASFVSTMLFLWVIHHLSIETF